MLNLGDVIAQVESNGDDDALRFESGLYVSWATQTPARLEITSLIRGIHRCSIATAHMIACTSWGRYQILGENLYSAMCGCKIGVFHYVADPDFQSLCFQELLHSKHIAFTFDDICTDRDKRQAFIAAYNGPDAVDDYWARIKDVVKRLGGVDIAD